MKASGLTRIAIMCAALVAGGCATDGAIFFTKTSVSVAEVDGTPPEANVGFHRIEGVILPRNPDGSVPSVLAHVRSNRDFLNPQIKHVYATGEAALNLVKKGTVGIDSPKGKDEAGSATQEQRTVKVQTPNKSETETAAGGDTKAPVVFFATSTSAGIRVGISPNGGVDGVMLFGFRRKELSVVPKLAKDGEGNFIYPPLIATQSLTVKPEAGKDSLCQGFATGDAARALANLVRTGKDSNLGCDTISIQADLLGQYRESVAMQDSEVVRIYRCFVQVEDGKFSNVLGNANQLKLFQDDQAHDRIKSEKDIKKARAAYIDEIGISIGNSSDRSARLLGHRVYVCDLAKQS